MMESAGGDTSPPTRPTSPPPARRPRIKAILSLAIFALVLWGISRTVQNGSSQFREQQEKLEEQITAETEHLESLAAEPDNSAKATAKRQSQRRLDQLKRQRFRWSSVKWSYLLLAMILYTIGMTPSWLFFHQTLVRLGQSPRWLTSFRAFFIGHLGKYVPGKALVVVLRSTLVAGRGVSLGAGIVAVFVETLTMMAVGATIGGLLLVIVRGDQWLTWGAAALACLAGIPTLPPLFRAVVSRLQRKKSSSTLDLSGISWSLMASGWMLLIIEWFFFGSSLAATLLAIPGVAPETVFAWTNYGLITATVALAIVVGFVSLVPGGAGIREWIVTTVLGSIVAIGPIRALIAAILLRFVWLIPETIMAGIGYLLPGARLAVTPEK